MDNNSNNSTKNDRIVLAIIFIIGFVVVIIGYILYQYPKYIRKQEKEKIEKLVMSYLVNTKKEIKNNPKQGKKYYELFLKYHSKLYLYNHNKIALSYLKKAAYDGYLKAEIDYVKYLSVSQHILKIYDRNKYGCYSIDHGRAVKYIKMIVFTKAAAKQGYKPFELQVALLYIYGSNPIYYRYQNSIAKSTTPYSGSTVRLYLQNRQKGKKMLYNLADEKYKPAMTMVNNIYNKNIIN